MRGKPDHCRPPHSGFADRPVGCVRASGAGASRAADEVRPPIAIQFSFRPPARGQRGPLCGGGEPRPVRRRGSGGLNQHRRRTGGRDCPGRLGRQRFRTGRYQRTDPLSRQTGCGAGKSGIRAVQQGAVRHYRPSRTAASARSPISKARPSASPKVTSRSGSGRRWRIKTQSRSQASKQAKFQPGGARADACRPARSTPSADFHIWRGSI